MDLYSYRARGVGLRGGVHDNAKSLGKIGFVGNAKVFLCSAGVLSSSFLLATLA